MSKIVIEIETDSAAFDVNREHEVGRILHTLAENIIADDLDLISHRPIYDTNRHTVGKLEVIEQSYNPLFYGGLGMGHKTHQTNYWCDGCGCEIINPDAVYTFGPGDPVELCNYCHSEATVEYQLIKVKFSKHAEAPK